MKLALSIGTLTAAIAALSTAIIAATPAEAIEWRLAVERHYEAAEETKFVPRGDNPQWDFDLDTVVNDMEWRQRTARMLRNLPKPAGERRYESSGQIADRREPPRPRFSF